MKEISESIYAVNQFLYLKRFQALIISDLHAGYEESLNKEGIFIPRSNTENIINVISETIKKINNSKNKISKIILNGDIIHSFNKHSSDEKYSLNKILTFLSGHAALIIIKGNHDKILSYIMKNDVEIYERLIFDDVLITHGDIIDEHSVSTEIKTIIIGHDHPSITLRSGSRAERFKCFLKGKYKNKTLIVMPSCNFLIEGTDVFLEKTKSPYIKKVFDFEVFIVGDEIYDFGRIKDLN